MSSADWLAFDDCTSAKKDHNAYATIILCWTPTPEKGWRVVLLSNTNVKKWSPCRTSAAHENKRVLVSAVVVRDEHATASAESGAVPQRLYIATPRRLYSKATSGFATGSKNKQFHLLSPPLSPLQRRCTLTWGTILPTVEVSVTRLISVLKKGTYRHRPLSGQPGRQGSSF